MTANGFARVGFHGGLRQPTREDDMRIWTLTTDSDGIETTVHRSESDAVAALFDAFDPTGEYAGDVQALLDGQGIVAYIDEHEIEVG